MHRSFAVRLAVSFAAVGVLAAASTALLVNLAFGSRFTDYLAAQQRAREAQVVAGLADAYRPDGTWDQEALDRLGGIALMDGGTVRLEDLGGLTVWEASESTGHHRSAMHRRMTGTGALGAGRRLPVRVDGRTVGYAVVRLPQPGVLPQDRSFRGSVNGLLLAGAITAGLVALLLGALLARRATAPARRLTEAARAMANGDRSRRVGTGRSDEFGRMGAAFDRMADAIDEEDRLRRAFAADVAHELRTPLAILRSQVEAMQDGLVDASPAALTSLHDETLRLTGLVADLETLASAEASGFGLDRRPTAVGPIVEEVLGEFAGVAEGAGVDLRSSIEDVEVNADPARVRQMLGNLLSNACKFTPRGGTVDVSLGAEDGWALLRVRDTGPGIPEDALPRVFERFYRGPGVRVSGSGIGLTVVRELARAHGGEVEARSREGRGATFTVRLPGASRPADRRSPAVTVSRG